MQEADHGGRSRVAVAIMGDFSGREWLPAAPPPPRRAERVLLHTPVSVSEQGVDGVLRRLRPSLSLTRPGSGATTIEFGSLADFEPEAMRQRLPRDARSDECLRAALHHPALQALEAAWRGVALLTRELRSSPVALSLIDATATELERALDRPAPPAICVSSVLLQPERAEPIHVVVWLAEHAATPPHMRRLRAAARAAAQAGCSVVSAAHPSIAALDATEPGPGGEAGRLWRELREASESEHLQLVMPRVLLRAPYGPAHGASTNGRPFEELPPRCDVATVHARLLWGNPALIAAVVLAGGGDPEMLAVDRLPTVRTAPGDPLELPGAESYLAEESAGQLMQRGVTPLICLRETGTVRLPALRSVSARGAPLRTRDPASVGGLAAGAARGLSGARHARVYSAAARRGGVR